MRKTVSMFIMVLLTSVAAWSQGKISGTVKDQNGDPVPFATVNVKGTKVTVAADVNANFTIPAKSGDVLVITAVGIDPLEVTVGNDPVITATVNRTSGTITDVVVTTALGIRRSKNELPYAAQQVLGDEVSMQRSGNFINNLNGKVAGLQINQSNSLGGSTNAVLRGNKSLAGSNQALFVIDGVPVSNNITNSGNQTTGRGGYDYGNAAADINPDDIASITVLKGAAASALYGSRGFNGVILITTKKGRKGLGVTVNAGVTTGGILKSTFAKYQKSYGGGYGHYYEGPDSGPNAYNFLYRDINGDGEPDLVDPTSEDASYGAAFDPNLMVYQWDAFDTSSAFYGKAKPWVAAKNGPETFFQTPFSYNTSVFVDGGDDKATFKLGYTKNDDQGVLPNSRVTKDGLNLGGDLKLTDKLTASANIDYSRVKGLGRYGTGYDSKNLMTTFRQWFQVNNDLQELKQAYFRNRQNITWNWADPTDLTPIYWDNPYWVRYENYENDSRSRYFGYASLNYKPAEWVNILGRVSLDHFNQQQEERIAVGSVDPSLYSRYLQNYSEYNYDILATFIKSITTDLKFNGLLGMNIRRDYSNSIFSSTNGGLIVPGVYSLSNSVSTPLAPTETDLRYGTDSYFGGATFTYKEVFTLDGTLRRDQYSTLPRGNDIFYYPSVSAGFIFSNLLPGAKSWLNYGKLRANYAVVGNDMGPYNVFDTYVLGSPFNGQPLASVPSTKSNEDLVPEKIQSKEIGIELGFLKNRITADLTYYYAKSIDQLVPVAVSTATGYSFKYYNSGTVRNKGIEATLMVTPVKTKDLTWDLTFNFTQNRNKVLVLHDSADNLQLASFQGGVSINATLGKPYGTIRGSDYIYTNGQKTVGSNGYYSITSASNNLIGDPNPDWMGSVSSSLRYKNLSFSFLIDTKQGGDIFSLDLYYGLATGLYPETAGMNDLGNPVRNLLSDGGGLILPGVTADGKENTTRVSASNYGTFGYARNPAKTFVYDASFVKLREAAISYSLPSAWLNDGKFIKGIDLSVVGRNLWIIHKNLPYADPEEIISAGNYLGYQGGAYPTVRTFTFNIKARF
ncbi:SusC/RagA family TonB-linked outer membrane protein [Parafilimonas sp.]|uniref:SusC/RagA family TonB-linked outer membrane protein n=1 Tax=Parafilimonas sp. TaxID=1969739 RepID=UPI003F7F94FD